MMRKGFGMSCEMSPSFGIMYLVNANQTLNDIAVQSQVPNTFASKADAGSHARPSRYPRIP